MQSFKGNIYLFLAALAWGSTFVVQRTAMDHLGPFTYSGIRFMLGSFFLLPLAFYRFRNRRPSEWQRKQIGKWLPVWGSLLAGTLVFFGINLQQIGLVYSTAGKGGFITGLYVIMVPIIGLFLGQRINVGVWIGAPIALVGLYLLSVTESLTLAPGDGWILTCAFVWAFQVVLVGWLSPRIDSIILAVGQSFVCAILSIGVALCIEDISLTAISNAGFDLVYGGVVSVGLGFTLQVAGQKYSQATHAAIILQLEAVFAVLAGWLFLNEVLSSRAFTGIVFMFAGMLIAQLYDTGNRLRKSKNRHQ